MKRQDERRRVAAHGFVHDKNVDDSVVKVASNKMPDDAKISARVTAL